MTAPAAIIASFVQPAASLAMGDTVGGAVGGFEAILAMLQGGADGKPGEGLDPAAETETQSETGDLAALLGQSGAAGWLTQSLSQSPIRQGAEEPMTGGGSRTIKAAISVATAGVSTEAATTEATGLDTLLARQAPEKVDPALLQRREPVSGQQPLPVPAPTFPAEDPAIAVAAAQAMLQSANEPASAMAETVAVPTVMTPPVETKPATPTRKVSSAGDAKAAKVQAAEAGPTATSVADVKETLLSGDDELAPVELVAREAEAPDTPARTADATAQAITARLEAVAAGATAFAAQVRGAPETVAKLAAGILDKLEGQATRFDLQLDPHGLGKVDVSVEIGADGKLTAQLGFDNAVGLSELRGRAQELRSALEQAGFNLAEGALSFDFNGERRQQQATDGQSDRTEQAGKAFARAQGALDEELAATPTRYQARRGLDLLI
jgi:hypothetical protein